MQRFFKNIYKKLYRWLNNLFKMLVLDRTDLLVLDSFFPNPLSVFRYVEFNTYVENFESLVYTTGRALSVVGEKKDIRYFIKLYPIKRKVKVFNYYRRVKAKLAVSTFVNETHSFLPYIEKNKIPFIFTLYPGGGFQLNNETSDSALKRIFSSQFFQKVIVTQNITLKYLIENKFVPQNKIEFIYGVPMKLSDQKLYFNRYNEIKDTFDICFVAAKYTKRGEDKGYDIFIEVARKLAKLSEKFRFHIVGGFNQNDIDIEDIGQFITFNGYLPIEKLREFYSTKDIIISPNRSNKLADGAFDGFPTASVVEAGLAGVVMILTDELNQNLFLSDNQNSIFINHNSDNIVDKVMHLFYDKNELVRISKNGVETLQNIFSFENQMKPRLKLISDYLNLN